MWILSLLPHARLRPAGRKWATDQWPGRAGQHLPGCWVSEVSEQDDTTLPLLPSLLKESHLLPPLQKWQFLSLKPHQAPFLPDFLSSRSYFPWWLLVGLQTPCFAGLTQPHPWLTLHLIVNDSGSQPNKTFSLLTIICTWGNLNAGEKKREMVALYLLHNVPH